jgi:hypothetical protein
VLASFRCPSHSKGRSHMKENNTWINEAATTSDLPTNIISPPSISSKVSNREQRSRHRQKFLGHDKISHFILFFERHLLSADATAVCIGIASTKGSCDLVGSDPALPPKKKKVKMYVIISRIGVLRIDFLTGTLFLHRESPWPG